MKFKSSFAILGVAILVSVQSGRSQICDFGPAADQNELEENWLDYDHLDAELSFIPSEGKVLGDLSLHFRVRDIVLDTLWLHGPGIVVEQSFLNGEEIQMHGIGKRIALTQTHLLKKKGNNILRLIYQAQPRKGLYFIGWNDSTNRAPKQIWTQGQGIDNRHWIPHWDHLSDKLTTEIKVTFEEGYTVVSNGALVSKEKLENGKIQWHYLLEKPHSSYLIMLGIGQFEVASREVEGINLELYYSDYQEIEPNSYLNELAEMVGYLNSRISYPYPWGTFRLIPVRDYMHGAMENTTAVIMSDRLVRPDKFNDFSWVAAHEYAHQWFGDLITGTTQHDHWLHESFATYYHMEWLRFRFGESYYREIREQYRNSIFLANQRDSIPVAKERSGSDRQYYKGGWVINMFEDLIGQYQFDELMRDYLSEFAYQNITTETFLGFIHQQYGGKYDLFWQQWICEAGEPHVEAKKHGNDVEVNFRNNTGGISLPELPHLEFFSMNDSSSEVIRKISPETEFSVKLALPSDNIGWAVDPKGEVLAEILENKTIKEFRFDLKQNQFQHLRLRSFKSMLKYNPEGSWQGLANQVLRNETSEELIKVILSVGNLQVDDQTVCKLLYHPNRDIRVLALKKMEKGSACFDDLSSLYKDAEGQEKLAIAEVGLQFDLYSFVPLIEKTSWQEFESEMDQIDVLVLKYLINQNPIDRNMLLDFTSESFSFDVRLKAIQQLENLMVTSQEYLESVVAASAYFNRKLSSPAREILKSFYLQNEFHQHIEAIVRNSELTKAEKDTMFNLFKRWRP